MLNQICWISLQPVADTVANAYSIDATSVNTISLVYMGVYLFVNFPSNYIIDTYGCRVGVIVGTLLTFLGMWVKCLVNKSFAVCVVGQMISAMGQPFLTNSPAKVSALWFSEKGVIITSLICLESYCNHDCNSGKSSRSGCRLSHSSSVC
jgi:FLVCR family feline leukemia virus subgroup C receptor-related protein